MVIARESDEGKAKDCICREKREREGEGSHSSGVGIGKALIVDRGSRAVTVMAQHRELPSEEEPPPYTDTHTHSETQQSTRQASQRWTSLSLSLCVLQDCQMSSFSV
ncbi:hypothetical protein Q7C36_002307 [Tachysurus vachellii]|uniref:Uncharacterized protein n=1 Tax=Tachysurus vachellii TaxID=175792 RepID=A0AA88NVW5_TACVA|nr:hypothetical protein Q7C36_002307 [Tachysurus vachellii]